MARWRATPGVLRRVLSDAAEHLPGEHHFYITFLSKADGETVAACSRNIRKR
jgi:hypothetical protein